MCNLFASALHKILLENLPTFNATTPIGSFALKARYHKSSLSLRQHERARIFLALSCWRRLRDSNPRYPCGHDGFQDRCFRPLSQTSTQAQVYHINKPIATDFCKKIWFAFSFAIKKPQTKLASGSLSTSPTTFARTISL